SRYLSAVGSERPNRAARKKRSLIRGDLHFVSSAYLNSVQRLNVQPQAASILLNLNTPHARIGGCNVVLGANSLKLHVSPCVRVRRILPKQKLPSLVGEVVIRSTARGLRHQFELKRLMSDIADPPPASVGVRTVIDGAAR